MNEELTISQKWEKFNKWAVSAGEKTYTLEEFCTIKGVPMPSTEPLEELLNDECIYIPVSWVNPRFIQKLKEENYFSLAKILEKALDLELEIESPSKNIKDDFAAAKSDNLFN